MKTFRERYEELEGELFKAYSELKESKKEFIFLTDEDIENGDCEDYFEVIDDFTGNIFDAHIIQVDEHGIKVVKSEDDNQRYYIGFKDLASVLDRINLNEMMQLLK